jgi:16S rRNA (guanine527-N7)-methyltransferase
MLVPIMTSVSTTGSNSFSSSFCADKGAAKYKIAPINNKFRYVRMAFEFSFPNRMMEPMYKKYFPNLPNESLTKFTDLKRNLIVWNDKINVISRKSYDRIEVEHILHSLAIACFIQFKPGSKVLDFGTGGGFPGLPLAIMFPEVEFLLVDSIAKKIKVVENLASELNLNNVTALCERAENIDGQFDFVTCRAVGRIGKILPWVRNKISTRSKNDIPNGFIFLKGGDLKEELLETKLSAKRIPISLYFEDPFFETKEIVYLSKQQKKQSK